MLNAKLTKRGTVFKIIRTQQRSQTQDDSDNYIYDRILILLWQAREDAGLTQIDVAEKLDVYASYISKCESGERRIDVIELAEFCRIYGERLAEFLKIAGLA